MLLERKKGGAKHDFDDDCVFTVDFFSPSSVFPHDWLFAFIVARKFLPFLLCVIKERKMAILGIKFDENYRASVVVWVLGAFLVDGAWEIGKKLFENLIF